MEKLLLVDFPLTVSGMTSLLQESEMKNIQIRGAGSFGEMETLLKKEKFNMLIIGIPIKTGVQIAILMDIMRKYHHIPIIVFNDEEMFLPEKKLYRAGLHGVLSRGAEKEEIISAIRQVKAGGIYISQSTFQKFLMQDEQNIIPFKKLTTREREVADLLIKGKKNHQIGEALTLMPSTVSTFKTKIFNKLHIKSILELEKASRELKEVKR